MEIEAVSRRIPQRSNRRIWATAVLSTALVVVTGLAPAIIAAPPPTVVKSPPFKVASWVPSVSVGRSGCGRALIPNSPAWSSRTGIGVLALTARTPFCTSKTGAGVSNSAATSAGFSIGIPVKFSTGGNHTLLVSWTLNLTVNQSIPLNSRCPTPAPPPGQTAYSSCTVSGTVSLNIYGFLEDFTNASGVGPWNYWVPLLNSTSLTKSTSCNSGGCSVSIYQTHSQSGATPFTGHTAYTWAINATGAHAINASHQYGLLFQVSAAVSVSDSGWPFGFAGTGAYETLNMATGGDAWRLTQIQIS